MRPKKINRPEEDFNYKMDLLTEAAKADFYITKEEEDLERILFKLDSEQKMLFIELIDKLKKIETLKIDLLLKTIASKYD